MLSDNIFFVEFKAGIDQRFDIPDYTDVTFIAKQLKKWHDDKLITQEEGITSMNLIKTYHNSNNINTDGTNFMVDLLANSDKLKERGERWHYNKNDPTNHDDDIVDDEGMVFVYAPFTSFGSMQKLLEEGNYKVISSELERIPNSFAEVTEEQEEEVMKLVERLEEDDDVQNVFHNMK